MKSAYCIAITACLTVIWLYEEKKKRGMAGKLCWKAAAGYLITRFVFFAISNQEVHGFLEVMAMDLVTAGLLYILFGKNGSREIADKIKLIDIVVELVDARAPYSSKNPLILFYQRFLFLP